LIELIPSSYVERLKIDEIFARPAPLEVDLGCGDGSFLASLAAMHPAHNFLGVERLAGRVRSACHKARNLSNARVLRIETTYAVRYLLPAGSVSVFHFLFPDPWPKRRHHERRVFKEDFLDALITTLESGGLLFIATDQQDYFDEMTRVVRTRRELEVFSEDLQLPVTTFEKRFRASGHPIYRMALRKTSPLT
jgi:tRNA (guanine-N7-)-methyltransferase